VCAVIGELRFLLRLSPDLGGDGTTIGIAVLNDTGSDYLTVFETDLPLLGNMEMYSGQRNPVTTRDANGVLTPRQRRQRMAVQVRLVRGDDSPWGDWIDEDAVVKRPLPGVPRLSGYQIRRNLFFGTSPTHHHVAVATTKGGMSSLL